MLGPCLGRTGSVLGGYNGASKWVSERRKTRLERVATVTPYLSQCRETVESASGESWGRLARTMAAFRAGDAGSGPE
jgi:hypothetical protein